MPTNSQHRKYSQSTRRYAAPQHTRHISAVPAAPSAIGESDEKVHSTRPTHKDPSSSTGGTVRTKGQQKRNTVQPTHELRPSYSPPCARADARPYDEPVMGLGLSTVARNPQQQRCHKVRKQRTPTSGKKRTGPKQTSVAATTTQSSPFATLPAEVIAVIVAFALSPGERGSLLRLLKVGYMLLIDAVAKNDELWQMLLPDPELGTFNHGDGKIFGPPHYFSCSQSNSFRIPKMYLKPLLQCRVEADPDLGIFCSPAMAAELLRSGVEVCNWELCSLEQKKKEERHRIVMDCATVVSRSRHVTFRGTQGNCSLLLVSEVLRRVSRHTNDSNSSRSASSGGKQEPQCDVLDPSNDCHICLRLGGHFALCADNLPECVGLRRISELHLELPIPSIDHYEKLLALVPNLRHLHVSQYQPPRKKGRVLRSLAIDNGLGTFDVFDPISNALPQLKALSIDTAVVKQWSHVSHLLSLQHLQDVVVVHPVGQYVDEELASSLDVNQHLAALASEHLSAFIDRGVVFSNTTRVPLTSTTANDRFKHHSPSLSWDSSSVGDYHDFYDEYHYDVGYCSDDFEYSPLAYVRPTYWSDDEW